MIRRWTCLLSSLLILGGLTGCTTVRWKSSWHEERLPVAQTEVIIYYAASNVPYPYSEIARCVMKGHASHGKPAPIPHVNREIMKLIPEAAKMGAKGLILTTPESPAFPPICLADNASDEPLCGRLSVIEAIAIVPK